MAKFANQKTFKINRPDLPIKKTEPFLAIEKSTLFTAMQLLNGVPLKLYLYLLSNKEGFQLDYSPQYFADHCGVSLNAAKQAVGSLIECGYLIPMEGRGNHYDFYPIPQSIPTVIYTIFEIDGERKYMTKTEFTDFCYQNDITDIEENWTEAIKEYGKFTKNEEGIFIKYKGGK